MKYCKDCPLFCRIWMLAVLAMLLGLANSGRAATTTVSFGSFFFTPKSVTINVGDTVVFTTSEPGAHTVTGIGSDPVCGSGIVSGTSCQHTFTSAGTFPYECIVPGHAAAGMTGTVIVQAAAAPPTVSLTGPANNVTNNAPTMVVLSATASGNGGNTISKVEFFDESTLVGTSTVSPYSVTLNPVNGGIYVFTAKATDSGGLSTTTSAVTNYIRGAVITPVALADGEFQFTLASLNTAKTNMIEFSADLKTWAVLTNFLPASSSVVFTDSSAIGQPVRYYRHSVLR